ncbi:MAG: DUF1643 domain-containing protein [Bacteroidota bacterium]
MQVIGQITDTLNEKLISIATISACEKYRYTLSRIWDSNKPKVMFVMLNPSTADSDNDDPTIRRCIGFAKSWGYGGLVVCNLFAYRATNPKDLLKVENPVGDENLIYTKAIAEEVEVIVCAWGNNYIVKKILKTKEGQALLEFASDKLHYLKLSKNKTPMHPLYLRSDLKPTKFD